jgi:hypothetical protein
MSVELVDEQVAVRTVQKAITVVSLCGDSQCIQVGDTTNVHDVKAAAAFTADVDLFAAGQEQALLNNQLLREVFRKQHGEDWGLVDSAGAAVAAPCVLHAIPNKALRFTETGGSSARISDDGLTASVAMNQAAVGYTTVALSPVIWGGQAEATFVVGQARESTFIGMIPAGADLESQGSMLATGKGRFMKLSNASLYGSGKEWTPGGGQRTGFKPGDRLTVRVDCEKETLEFFKNGICSGPRQSQLPGYEVGVRPPLIFAVQMHAPGSSVKLEGEGWFRECVASRHYPRVGPPANQPDTWW